MCIAVEIETKARNESLADAHCHSSQTSAEQDNKNYMISIDRKVSQQTDEELNRHLTIPLSLSVWKSMRVVGSDRTVLLDQQRQAVRDLFHAAVSIGGQTE